MSERAQLVVEVPVSPAVRPQARRWMPTLAAGLSIGQYARSLLRRLAFLTTILLVAIWALDGQGILLAGVGAARARRGRAARLHRGLGLAQATGSGAPGGVRVGARRALAAVILVVTWLLTWLLAGVSTRSGPPGRCSGSRTAGSAYSLIALHDRVLVAHGRRALRARIDLLTRTRRQAVDAQAAELRRIERDLHDGAQARLVALTLQLGTRRAARATISPRSAA